MNVTQDQGRTIAGSILVGLGAIFLLGQTTGFDFFGMAWPLFVLLPGLIFLVLAFRGTDNSTVGFIFPGMIITGTGLILTYQNVTGHWESWAYIWTLYPVFVGVGMRYFGYRTNNAEPAQVGRMLMIGGIMALVGFGALFELFLFGGVGLGVLAPVIPLAMIAVGLFIIFRNQSESKAKRKSHDL